MRQIIVLESNPSDGGYISLNVVFWFAIPAGSRVNRQPFKSAINSVLAGGGAVTGGEQAELDSGAVYEELSAFRFPAQGAQAYTTAQIKAELQAAYAARAVAVAALPNKIQYYGVFWDGAAWSA